ncbi:MAG: FecR domain-containing protein [Parabacteroides sp.]|nr:FecR domain-containing protein [Parabacteroides sp.]
MEKEILYKFFDGKASDEEKEAVRIWLESSPENERTLFREREFFDAMILSGGVKVAKAGKKSRPLFRTVLFEAIKIAAVFALTVACGTYFYQSEIRKISEAMNTITVPAGQRVNLTLPDGTNVWLNARSELRYPAAFTGNKREITLDGEAYFEVTRNEGKPFVVRTDKCNVEVLGTKFNVEAYGDSDDFCTSLMEGAVKIVNRSASSVPVVLKPNQEARLQNGSLSVSAIGNYDRFRWRDGLVCFNNIAFKDLMVRFEKCFGVSVIVENESLKEYSCSGKFRISDGVDNALRILQRNARYVIEKSEDGSVIYIK